MPEQAKRVVLVSGFAVWTKAGSPKVWIEAGEKWANYIIDGDGWSLAEVIIKLAPYGVGTLLIAIYRWHAKKLKKHLGPKGVWIGLDPTKLMEWPNKGAQWWKYVDARPRDNSNRQKEPVPW